MRSSQRGGGRLLLCSLLCVSFALSGCGVHAINQRDQRDQRDHTGRQPSRPSQERAAQGSSGLSTTARVKTRSRGAHRRHLAPTLRASRWSQNAAPNALSGRVAEHHVVVAALLPLSGRYKRWGGEVKRALTRHHRRAPHLSWVFMDTGGDRSTAIERVEEAVHASDAQVILGPLSPWASAAVSARAQWYEMPWFGLGSFPAVMRHPFAFSWRLEAEDVARAMARALCTRAPRPLLLLVSDRPRAQLTARSLSKQIRRCGLTYARVEQLSTYLPRDRREPAPNLSEERGHASRERLLSHIGRSGRLTQSDHWVESREIQPQSSRQAGIVMLTQGADVDALIRLLRLRDMEIERSPHRESHSSQRSPLTIYTGLGVTPRVSLRGLNVKVIGLQRPPLSRLGRETLDAYPQSSTLALELLDVTLWLEEAARLHLETKLSYTQALNEVRTVRGAWGPRVVRRSALIAPKLSETTLDRSVD